MMASLDDVFDFVDFYVEYYRSGPGSADPRTTQRWKNAARVQFNIETKVRASRNRPGRRSFCWVAGSRMIPSLRIGSRAWVADGGRSSGGMHRRSHGWLLDRWPCIVIVAIAGPVAWWTLT